MDLIKLSKIKGFLSKDKLITVNSEYYYLWMCELQQWLREEHQIIIDIQTDCTSNPKYCYQINIFKGNPRDLAEMEWGWYFHKQEDWCLYYTYEEALEAGLQEALTLINIDIKFK